MKTTTQHGIPIYHEPGDLNAAEVIKDAAEHCTEIIKTEWGMDLPGDCRIYVMTSGDSFMFQSAPWTWRLLLVPAYPLWIWRVKRLWKVAGGWAQRYGSRQAIGVKPPRLLEEADKSIGNRIFIKEGGPGKKVAQITCHELTHGFTAALKLPAWLNEGLAMVMVDQYTGKQTVLQETLSTLADDTRAVSPKEYRRLNLRDADGLIYLYSRGYWITRYYLETEPQLMRQILQERRRRDVLISLLSEAVGVTPKNFWGEINQVVIAHFLKDD